MEKNDSEKLSKIVALAKRRGFIYQGSEIYGGLAGTWDYGPFGVTLKNNIKNLWWKRFIDNRDDMFGVDASILMNAKVWESVGHVDGFTDTLVECLKCHKRFRSDHLKGDKCPDCGSGLSDERQFNMMFKTQIGAIEDSSATVYLRPETAQGMFVNFKNVIDSLHPRIPFGLGQIGKAFRNEITPKDFIFRVREFEQMEIEYFIREEEWEKYFEYWKDEMWKWIDDIGLKRENVHELEISEDERAHYSKRTIDFEYDFPFGRKELYGLAYRTDFDLKNHMDNSKVSLEYFDDASGEKFIPHVIEPTFGVERTVFAILAESYTEDKMSGETRVFLKLKPSIAPVKAMVSPLLKNKPELVEKAREVYVMLKKEIPQVMWDDNGNIGKRYRRQDEIGTPYCVTIDFDTLEDATVTIRDRDKGGQERIAIDKLTEYIKQSI